MKISELWLREWVNPSLTGAQLAAQLTMAGLEVDEVAPVAGDFNRVVVAHVVSTTPHPKADKLTLCDVDAGAEGILKIVCGASNVRPNLRVALALCGAELPGDFHIKESMLRGELSQGMLCSGSELGLEDASEGIMELADDAPIGADLRQYLQLDDHVLDIDLTPNRADCFGVLGIAREVAALNQLPFQRPYSLMTHEPVLNHVLPVDLQASDACSHYCGRLIRGIDSTAETPLWMLERLRRSGLRSVHPVVDVTNYVMLELGQPMHAFDHQAIQGSIQVRYGRDDETIVLLNGQSLALNAGVLVISDEDKPLAIAGVMGGEASAVDHETTDIFLESAFFNPLIIAGVARQFGLFSDSSQRFERGVDPSLQREALDRATDLLCAIVGGAVGPVIEMSSASHMQSQPSVVSFDPKKVKQLTGLDIPYDVMQNTLKHLGMTVSVQDETWVVGVPTHRFDISLDVDLVEEIIRFYGYDHIQGLPLSATLQAGTSNHEEDLLSQLSTFLSHRGYHETISYAFVDPELQQALYPDIEGLSLLNPMSAELSVMRVGLWPGLIASTIYNAHRQQSTIQCFEAGVVFERRQGIVTERTCIAGLLMGKQGLHHWSESSRTFDFYDMKGDIESLFVAHHLPQIAFVPGTHPALHPGQTARILVNGVEAGWLGVLHPRFLDALDLVDEVILFELSLNALLPDAPPVYQPISKYPQIRRDLSLLVNQKVTAFEIEQAVRDVVPSSLLKSFDVFDVYQGESIPEGKKSLAIGVTLQDVSRTLIDAEITTIISAILKKLDDDFGIILRADLG